MHKKIEELEKKIVECTLAKAEECGLEAIDTEELGAITDMIKDLAEARFHEATTKAMEEAEEYYDDMDEHGGKMGYDTYRYMRSGRFAPKGRGTYVGRGGYTPTPYMPMYGDGMGYTASNDPMRGAERYTDRSSRDDGRRGYSMPSTDRGRYYDEFANHRRNYTENQTADNRRMMEDAATRHVDEFVASAREMWKDVDQPTRTKMKESLVKLVNEMA